MVNIKSKNINLIGTKLKYFDSKRIQMWPVRRRSPYLFQAWLVSGVGQTLFLSIKIELTKLVSCSKPNDI